MVNVGRQIEPANNATVAVSDAGLLLIVAPFATSPITVVHCTDDAGVMLIFAVAIAIVMDAYLRRVQSYLSAALVARDNGFRLPARRTGQALPFTVALVTAACDMWVRRPFLKRRTAHRARIGGFPAAIVAVVRAAMLMRVDVASLLARVQRFGHNAPTPASTDHGRFVGAVIASAHHRFIPFCCVIQEYYTSY